LSIFDNAREHLMKKYIRRRVCICKAEVCNNYQTEIQDYDKTKLKYARIMESMQNMAKLCGVRRCYCMCGVPYSLWGAALRLYV
jgi:hypothetical protein